MTVLEPGARVASGFTPWLDVDDGTTAQLIVPGASGYALVPWVMTVFGCLHENPVHQVVGGSQPWLVPALARWYSIYEGSGPWIDVDYGLLVDDPFSEDPHERIEELEAIETDHDLLMDLPMVSLQAIQFPDMYSVSPVTLDGNVWGYTARRMVATFNEASEGRLIDAHYTGLIPAWTVVPINQQYARLWLTELQGVWAEYPGLRYTEMLCPHGDAHHFDEDCDPYDFTYESCDCGARSCRENLDHLLVASPDFGEALSDQDIFEPTWAYAVDRFTTGWQHALSLARQGELSCSSSSLSERSPFWAFR